LLNSSEEHRAVEDEIYSLEYQGYVPDPRFVATARQLVEAEIQRRVPPPARVLDMGCGAGEFLEIARGLGYQVEGIDISRASAAICNSKGLTARAGDFLTEPFEGKFDLITMWDVVEHLRSPETFFVRARDLLSERGFFFAKVPSFGDLSVRVSSYVPRAAGLLLGAPEHVQYFDLNSLSKLLDRTGFRYEWLPRVEGGMRTPNRNGSVKRRMVRRVRDVIKSRSGDSNLYLLASRA